MHPRISELQSMGQAESTSLAQQTFSMDITLDRGEHDLMNTTIEQKHVKVCTRFSQPRETATFCGRIGIDNARVCDQFEVDGESSG